MTRVWMNHWFSAAYNIVSLIRQGVPDIQVIGSNEHLDSPIMTLCDEWYQEPVLKGEEYVSFCLDFCRSHNVDVFMPRRGLLPVSQYKERFLREGIKVMVDDYEFVSVLNKKDKAYDYFKKNNIGIVPEYFIATNVDQFKKAYDELSSKYEHVCFKFVYDEGGKSYRLIDNSHKGYNALFKRQTTRISFDAAVEAFEENCEFSPVMIMPFLSDEEISVDCLNTSAGLIAVPRVKDTTRIERVFYDDVILETCRNFYNHMPLENPCNIQFKYLKGVPYLLEVNTRMSGGIQLACAASGINIPAIAVNKLLGIDTQWINSRQEKKVTHVEMPVVLD